MEKIIEFIAGQRMLFNGVEFSHLQNSDQVMLQLN